MRALKVGVIGAGSTYTPELIDGLIKCSDELRLSRLVLMDIDEARLEIVGGLAQRMVKRAGVEFDVELTTTRSSGLEKANYVISQIRVGGMEARALDEKIPLEYGVIGQETTGPGGFAMALRTIPVMLEIAGEMEIMAPKARLINFTNPSGLITEALIRHSNVDVIGLCNAPITYQNRLAALFEVAPQRIRMDYFGLNHLAWIRRVFLDDDEITPEVFSKILSGDAAELPGYVFNKSFLQALNLIPGGYLQYYYHRDQVLEEMLQAEKCRAEVIMEIDRQILEMYRNPKLSEKPKSLDQRGGSWYSDAAIRLISAIENDKHENHIVNVRNRGSLTDLPDDCVVEIPARVSSNGPEPLPIGDLPLAVRGLVQQVKAYERLAIEAAVRGSKELALLALGNHPLVPSVDVAEKLCIRFLQAHRPYLPQFKNG